MKMIEGKLNYDRKKKLYIMVTSIHFILTFIWERLILVLDNGYEELISIPIVESYISARSEFIIIYILSKVICFALVAFLWYLLFYVVKKIEKKILIPIVLVFAIGLIIGIITYPDNYMDDIDNYTNYLYAVRLIPTYWQHVFTGAFYAGCCMTFPHPVSIVVIQWSLFVSTLGYIMQKINNCFGGKLYLLPLILLLLPDTFFIAYDPYRNNLYTILTVFYFSFLYFDIYKSNGALRWYQKVLYVITTALIASWRAEGIIVGFAGVLLYIIYIDIPKRAIKNKIIIVMCTLFACVLFNRIQNIGEAKYYGSDYSIVNTANVLSEIFNNPNANLSYENVDDDIEAINNIVSVEVLKEQGLNGLRSSNWSKGHKDFNQTLASESEAENYMNAYYNIVVHNLRDYLNVQLNVFFSSLGMSGTQFEQYSFSGESSVSLTYFQYTQWEKGQTELLATCGTLSWQQSNVRQVCYTITDTIRQTILLLFRESGLIQLLRVCSILFMLCICIRELIIMLDDFNKTKMFYFITSFFIILQYIGIILFMPVAREPYFYPMQYASFLIIACLICEKVISSRENKAKTRTNI